MMARTTPDHPGIPLTPTPARWLPGPAALAAAAATLLPATGVHAQEASPGQAPGAQEAVPVAAVDYALEAPESIPSGWTTIDFTNEGEEPHFLLLARLPDGHTFEEYSTDVVMPFNDIWLQLRAGEIGQEEVMGLLGAELPEWFSGVEFTGGTGIIHEGDATRISLHLEPGTYALECYMKTEEGELHNMEGMIRELTVTDTPSGQDPPEADIVIHLSNFDMMIEGDLAPGTHTVAVHVMENPEEGFGHNVHVAREPLVEVEEVVRWMNFLELDGQRPPPPASFMGGMHMLPEGGIGFFTLELEPGRYLFLSEYTAPFGVLQEVTVP